MISLPKHHRTKRNGRAPRALITAATAIALLLGTATAAHANTTPPAPAPDRGQEATEVTLTEPTGFAQLSTGKTHSVALTAQGKAFSWGQNNSGQIGDNSTTNRSTRTPAVMPPGVTFTQVYGGWEHSVALGSDGKAYAWGYNDSGRLGDNSTTNRLAPVAVSMPAGVTFTRISAKNAHSLAIGSNGKTYAWGYGSNGRLGNGVTFDQHAPTEVTVPTGVTFAEVSAGYDHSLALDGTGNAYAWGLNANGRLGDNSTTNRLTPVAVTMPAGVTFTQIVAGGHHSLALGSDGKAYAWGFNDYGQLGDGTTTQRTIPVAITMPAGVTFTQIAGGGMHSLALGSDGKTYAWGLNSSGQLGNGTTTLRTTPVAVTTPTGVKFTQLAAGDYHSVALGTDGETYTWGANGNSQLGDGTSTQRTTPTKVAAPPLPMTQFAQVAGGETHSVALDGTGRAYTWGSNLSGQLGDGTTTARSTPTAITMPAGVTFTQIDAGDRFSVALGNNGKAYSWGLNSSGQLGDSSTTQRLTPVEVVMPAGVTFTQISAGRNHALALGSDGNTYGWGDNTYKAIGDGTNVNRTSPVLVAVPDDVTFTQITAGSYHSLAIGDDGESYAWGRNANGQLGDGTTTERVTPVPIDSPENVAFIQVSAGSSYSLALGDDGNAYGWGANSSGQLGDASLTQRTKPVKVSVPVDVTLTQIAAGNTHSLAVASSGNAYGWGANTDGVIGDGTTTTRTSPRLVSMPEGIAFTQIAVGSSHSLAISSDRHVYGWGSNNSGRVGDGSTTTRTTPVLAAAPAGPVAITGATFDGIPATGLAHVINKSWRVNAPAHAPGPVEVVVTWSISGFPQTPFTYVKGFTYSLPSAKITARA